MDLERDSIEGKWYGVLVHQPNRGVIHVSFSEEHGSLKGTWDFPHITGGAGKKGEFTATRFGSWIHVHIKSGLLPKAEFRLTIVEAKSESMIYGVVPIERSDIPFATVTLFRHEPGDKEMGGLCPIIVLHPRDLEA